MRPRLSAIAIAIALVALAHSAQPAEAAPPPHFVKNCLSSCTRAMQRCRAKSHGRKHVPRGPKGKLKTCGCAQRRCIRNCRRYAYNDAFICSSKGPRPPATPKSRANKCRRDADCLLRPRHPCTCNPCRAF